MIPYKSIIQLERGSRQPIYLQLANQIMGVIKTGVLKPETRLPGSRQLADLLGIHRKTVVAAYEELTFQGWVETLPKKGTFVHRKLPVLNVDSLGELEANIPDKSGFDFYRENRFYRTFQDQKEGVVYLNDGVSDPRLTPLKDIAILYRNVCNSRVGIEQLNYSSTYGNMELRKVLVNYLNETRGLKIGVDNVLITRGSQMGIYLTSRLLLGEDAKIIVGSSNYISADYTFIQAGAELLRVPVDNDGVDTDEIQRLCEKHRIKAVYITSHHHHPTTKTLSAKRRLQLLNLSRKYAFAIIEDDYDYDFHYDRAPILPLASHDTNGNVVYIGSVCKTVAPAFRIGYLIAGKEFVDEAAKARRYIDRQGDTLLELAFARFIKSGDLDRHINKVLKVYKKRRDSFIRNLSALSDFFEFDIPDGGMAIWLILKAPLSWKEVAEQARRNKLEIGEWERYDVNNSGHNAIRMGFASYNEQEIEELFEKLRKTLHEVSKKPDRI